MKVIVTGSNGQLGTSVIEALRDQKVKGLDLENADIENDIADEEVIEKIVAEDPDVVVHTAAFTDVDGAEEDQEKAKEVNVQGTQNVVEAADQLDAHLIHISTDYVFDGKYGNYKEDDEPNPQSVYGETKYEAEKRALQAEKVTLFRTSVVFKQGFSNFFTWAKRELEKGSEVPAITDQVCCPTYAPNLADIIVEAAEKEIIGVYHATGDSKVTRYESVQIMKEELGLDGKVMRSKMDDLPWKAHRPKDSSLSLAKLKEDFETKPISLYETFRRMRG